MSVTPPAKRCAKEAHSANNGTPSIEHVYSQAPPLHKQVLRHIVDVLAVKLMITSDIHNRDRGEAPTRPLDASNADVNVAGQDNNIGLGLWRPPVPKLQVQIRKDANPHAMLTPEQLPVQKAVVAEPECLPPPVFEVLSMLLS